MNSHFIDPQTLLVLLLMQAFGAGMIAATALWWVL